MIVQVDEAVSHRAGTSGAGLGKAPPYPSGELPRRLLAREGTGLLLALTGTVGLAGGLFAIRLLVGPDATASRRSASV